MILNLLISIIIPSLQSLVAANLTECLEECGTSSIFFSDAIETRAFGATVLSAETLPFFGSITAKLPGCDTITQCSAVIIARSFILTASHCLLYKQKLENDCDGTEWTSDEETYKTYRANDVTFFAGSEDRTNSTKFTVKKLILYPTHKDSGGEPYVDLALVQLSTELQFSTKIRAACLPFAYNENPGETVQFVGYGKTGYAHSHTQLKAPSIGTALKHSDLAYITTTAIAPPELCKLKAANSSLYICAGMKGSGLAVGDSGGAVLVNKAGRYYAVGIASQTGAIASSVVTAENIRRDINPDLFIRTSTFCGWLNKKSKGLVSCIPMEPPSARCLNRFTNAIPMLTEKIVQAEDGGGDDDGTWEELPLSESGTRSDSSSSQEEKNYGGRNQVQQQQQQEDGSATTAADPSSVWAQGVKWLQSKLG